MHKYYHTEHIFQDMVGFSVYYLLKTGQCCLPYIYPLKASNWSQRNRKGWYGPGKVLLRFVILFWKALWWWLPFSEEFVAQIWRLTNFPTRFDGSEEQNKCAFITFTKNVFFCYQTIYLMLLSKLLNFSRFP